MLNVVGTVLTLLPLFFFLGYFLLLMSSLVIYVSVLSLTEKMVIAICYASNNVFYLFINICKH